MNKTVLIMVLASNAIWHISLKMHFACMHNTDFGQKCNAFFKILVLIMHFLGKINRNFDFYHALFWFCRNFSYHACILHAEFHLSCILHVCNYALHVCNAFNARTMVLIGRIRPIFIYFFTIFYRLRRLFLTLFGQKSTIYGKQTWFLRFHIWNLLRNGK